MVSYIMQIIVNISNCYFSIVMEYSDNGDLFQKITRH